MSAGGGAVRAVFAIAILLVAVAGASAQDAHHQGPAEETPEQAAERARLEKLVADADAKVRAKSYKESVPLFEQALEEGAKADLPAAEKQKILLHAAYDLACALSAAGDKEDAVKALALLPKLGYRNWEHVKKDPWFKPLLELESFRKL